MKILLAISNITLCLAGILATAATLFTMGGTLSLAEHYARKMPIATEHTVVRTRIRPTTICANPENLQASTALAKRPNASTHPGKTAT